MSVRTTRRRFAVAAGLSAALLLTACTGNTAEEADDGDGDTTSNAGASSSNDDTGETVTIGFSAPAADPAGLPASRPWRWTRPGRKTASTCRRPAAPTTARPQSSQWKTS